jgi:hypothetical protein
VVALLPLVVLGVGIAVRSELILLGGFPSALLVPISLDPAIAAAHLFGPVRFFVVAVGVVVYLLAGSYFMAFHEPAAPRSSRPLASAAEPTADRWQRRERVYWTLTALSVVCPLLGIYWVASIRRSTPSPADVRRPGGVDVDPAQRDRAGAVAGALPPRVPRRSSRTAPAIAGWSPTWASCAARPSQGGPGCAPPGRWRR